MTFILWHLLHIQHYDQAAVGKRNWGKKSENRKSWLFFERKRGKKFTVTVETFCQQLKFGKLCTSWMKGCDYNFQPLYWCSITWSQRSRLQNYNRNLQLVNWELYSKMRWKKQRRKNEKVKPWKLFLCRLFTRPNVFAFLRLPFTMHLRIIL